MALSHTPAMDQGNHSSLLGVLCTLPPIGVITIILRVIARNFRPTNSTGRKPVNRVYERWATGTMIASLVILLTW